MDRSVRPGETRQALADLQLALGAIARPSPVVFLWRWRYELALGAGLPLSVIALARAVGLGLTLGSAVVLTALVTLWPPARAYFVARAWCVITPHRVRAGCANAWIHSRKGKIPIVLLTRRESFGERVLIWCRAGTTEEDLFSARELLAAACWASEVTVKRSPRFAHLVTLKVIRRAPPGMPSGPVPRTDPETRLSYPPRHGSDEGRPSGGRVADESPTHTQWHTFGEVMPIKVEGDV
jgi:hypothetical protein